MKKLITYLTPLALLGGCFAPPEDGNLPKENPRFAGRSGSFEVVSGTAAMGQVVSGTVTAYSAENGVIDKNTIYGTASTDEFGNYEVELTEGEMGEVQPIALCLTDAAYVEESTLDQVAFETTDELCAIVLHTEGEDSETEINLFTHLMTGYVQNKVAAGMTMADAMAAGVEAMQGYIGVDASQVSEVRASVPNDTVVELSDGARMGYLSAGISELVRTSAIDKNETPFEGQYKSIKLARLMKEDVLSDGVLDGKKFGEDGRTQFSMSMGTTELNQSLYAEEMANAMYSFAKSANNKISIDSGRILEFAIAIATNEGDILGDWVKVGIDKQNPAVSHNMTDGQAVYGDRTASVCAEDLYGVAAITLTVASAEITGTEAANGCMEYNFNTTAYSSGDNAIVLTATDNYGNETMVELTQNFANDGSIVNSTSPLLTASTSETFTFNVNDLGLGVDSYSATIDSVPVAAINYDEPSKTISLTTTLSPGYANLEVSVTNGLGQTSMTPFTIGLDNQAPNFTDVVPASGDLSVNHALSLANPNPYLDNFNPDGLGTYLYVDIEKVSLNGVAATDADMRAAGYAFFMFNIDDDQGDGSPFAAKSDLTVTVDAKKNGTSFHTATLTEASEGEYILPVTTEGLGVDWFKAGASDTLTVEFTVTDALGNAYTHPAYEFKILTRSDDFIVDTTTQTNLDYLKSLVVYDVAGNAIDIAESTITNTSAQDLLVRIKDVPVANADSYVTRTDWVRSNGSYDNLHHWALSGSAGDLSNSKTVHTLLYLPTTQPRNMIDNICDTVNSVQNRILALGFQEVDLSASTPLTLTNYYHADSDYGANGTLNIEKVWVGDSLLPPNAGDFTYGFIGSPTVAFKYHLITDGDRSTPCWTDLAIPRLDSRKDHATLGWTGGVVKINRTTINRQEYLHDGVTAVGQTLTASNSTTAVLTETDDTPLTEPLAGWKLVPAGSSIKIATSGTTPNVKINDYDYKLRLDLETSIETVPYIPGVDPSDLAETEVTIVPVSSRSVTGFKTQYDSNLH